MRKLTVIIESAHQNFGAYIKEIDGITAIGYSLSEMKEKIEEAIQVYKEFNEEDGNDIPEVLKGEYELEFQLDVRTFLEVYAGILSKAGIERLSGINQKQLWHYANGTTVPRRKQVQKIQNAVHKLGEELCAVEFV